MVGKVKWVLSSLVVNEGARVLCWRVRLDPMGHKEALGSGNDSSIAWLKRQKQAGETWMKPSVFPWQEVRKAWTKVLDSETAEIPLGQNQPLVWEPLPCLPPQYWQQLVFILSSFFPVPPFPFIIYPLSLSLSFFFHYFFLFLIFLHFPSLPWCFLYSYSLLNIL